MAILEILKYPDPRLRIKAQAITKIDADLRRQIDDMYETMYTKQGIGLAGTQVNIHLQVLVLDVSENHKQPMCLINPEILHKEGLRLEEEGCLSVPGAYEKIKRGEKIRLRAMDIDGKIFELDAENMLAHCIQHEIDHLNGILFIDHLSRLKQDRLRKKMEKNRE